MYIAGFKTRASAGIYKTRLCAVFLTRARVQQVRQQYTYIYIYMQYTYIPTVLHDGRRAKRSFPLSVCKYTAVEKIQTTAAAVVRICVPSPRLRQPTLSGYFFRSITVSVLGVLCSSAWRVRRRRVTSVCQLLLSLLYYLQHEWTSVKIIVTSTSARENIV